MSTAYTTHHHHYYTTPALPIPPPTTKTHPHHFPHPTDPYYLPHHHHTSPESTYSLSPPEEDLLLDTTSSASSSSGYGHSYSVGTTTTGSYAGSSQGGSEYESGSGGSVSGSGCSAGGVDLGEYMQERFAGAAGFDSVGLDRCTVRQAKTSGHLNAKHRELLELQAKAQARLAKTRARFAQGLEDAREVRADLEWTQKKVASLKVKAAKKHPKEYTKARARYPSPDLY